METLCKITSMSKPRATRTITSLVKKGIIKKQRRGLTKANLYTIVDVPSMWGTDTLEEMKTVSESQMSDKTNEELIEELVKRGAITIVKEKELETTEPTKVTVESSTKFNRYDISKSIPNQKKSQVLERYTIEQIQQIFDYDILLKDKPLYKKDIDAVFAILHTALNTTKAKMRVGGEDKPTMVVIRKLIKLDYAEIKYCIEKYAEQTERIKNPTAYMLTLLYNAKEQRDLDISNQVNYDMYNWVSPTE